MLTKPIFSGLIAVGLGLVGLGLTATQPQALPHASLGQTWQDGTYAQTVQYRRDYGRRYGYGRGHGYGRGYGYGRQYGYGLAGLGVLGLLGGAAIASQGYYGPSYYGQGYYGQGYYGGGGCYYVRTVRQDYYGYPRRVRQLVCN